MGHSTSHRPPPRWDEAISARNLSIHGSSRATSPRMCLNNTLTFSASNRILACPTRVYYYWWNWRWAKGSVAMKVDSRRTHWASWEETRDIHNRARRPTRAWPCRSERSAQCAMSPGARRGKSAPPDSGRVGASAFGRRCTLTTSPENGAPCAASPIQLVAPPPGEHSACYVIIYMFEV